MTHSRSVAVAHVHRLCLIALLILPIGMVMEGGVSPPERPEPSSRLDRSLMRIVESGDPLEAAANSGYRVREDRIEVMVIARSRNSEDLVTWLWQHDARLVVVFRHLVRADVAPRILVDLASHPEVVWVRRPVECARRLYLTITRESRVRKG